MVSISIIGGGNTGTVELEARLGAVIGEANIRKSSSSLQRRRLVTLNLLSYYISHPLMLFKRPLCTSTFYRRKILERYLTAFELFFLAFHL
jgi:hypothetical protein